MSGSLPARLVAALAERYRLERELGAGGMATVYLAEDVKHHRKVAVKVLKPELAAVLGAERFVVEITTTAALQHPHILPLFDSGTADGFLYYVMPFIQGETLRAKLDRETQLGIDEALRITTDVADALDYAHRQGVIHRDIKPENILLHDGRPMVADFGIALAVSAAAGGRMTETGLSLGTPHYMSPEQATAEKEISARSDVYSLASVLYEMLTGSPPHVGASAQQIIMKIVTEDAAPVTKLRRAVPPNVAAAVEKALEKLPADRFASAAAFGAALSDPTLVARTSALRAPSLVAGTRSWKGATLLASAAALVFLAAALRGWWSPRQEASRRSWRSRIVLPDSAALITGMSLARDGSVFAVGGGDRIWVRTAEATEFVPLAGVEAAGMPAISPDGRRVAFLQRVPGGGADLVLRPLEAGPARVVVRNVELMAGFDWIDDDRIVYTALTGLRVVPAAGGESQRLTTVDSAAGEIFHTGAHTLPDNQGVVFTISMRQSNSSVIAVVGPEGGKPTRLLPGLGAVPASSGNLLVTRGDGTIVAVPFDAMSRTLTGAPVPLVSGLRTGAFSAMGGAAASAGGRLIYVSGGFAVSDDPAELLWLGRDGRATPAAPDWTGTFQGVARSPDGRLVAAGVITEGSEELQVRDLATGSIVRVAIEGTLLRDPVFSPDGEWMYFTGLGSSQGVYRVRPGGVAPPEPVVRADFTWMGHVAFAGHGDTLYYAKEVAAGNRRLLRYALSTRTTDTIPTPGGRAGRAQISPDGRWLAFRSSNADKVEIHVRATDLTRSEAWRIASDVDGLTVIRWSRAGNELFYVAHDSMMAVGVTTAPTFAAAAPRALFSTRNLTPVFDLGPDGRFLMIRHRPDLRPPTELTMVERWMDLLPR